VVTAEPTCSFPAAETVNVTVPSLTPTLLLVTVAFKVTGWLVVAKTAEELAPTVVVGAALTVRLWNESVLV
jgi:hypothetical protein